MEKKDIGEASGSGRTEVNSQPERRLKWEKPEIIAFSVDSAVGACKSGSINPGGGMHSFRRHKHHRWMQNRQF